MIIFVVQVLPRLWPFLSHSSSSVRKATLQTLETLTGEDGDTVKEQWGEDGNNSNFVLQEALRHVFQRVLIEHVPSIQQVAERVWQNLVVRSDLKLLLHASCPLVSTWLCLAMQPEHVPFNANLLLQVTPTPHHNSPNNKSQQQNSRLAANAANPNETAENHEAITIGHIKSLSDLKVYVGGIETVAQNTRHLNVVRARCMVARMLGLLSIYVVKPAPGVVYTPDIPSPAECYAKVLLAHLASRSSLQRTVVGLTMSHWAELELPNCPPIPDILR